MARKNSSKSSPQHGLNDLMGIGFLGLAFLLLVSLLSYDPKDLSLNSIPANRNTHNWIGLVGAYVACGSFWSFGVASYLLPLLLVLFGLAYWLEGLSYLRRRWPWVWGWFSPRWSTRPLQSQFRRVQSRRIGAWRPVACWAEAANRVSNTSACWGRQPSF
jgi:hypothetical protein